MVAKPPIYHQILYRNGEVKSDAFCTYCAGATSYWHHAAGLSAGGYIIMPIHQVKEVITNHSKSGALARLCSMTLVLALLSGFQ